MSEEKDIELWAKLFRLATPIMLTLLSLAVSILIGVINNQNAELRSLREKIEQSTEQSKQFAITYTDKMFDLVLKISDKKK